MEIEGFDLEREQSTGRHTEIQEDFNIGGYLWERGGDWKEDRERENRREGGISTALLCDWKFNREREGGRGRRSRMLNLDEKESEKERERESLLV